MASDRVAQAGILGKDRLNGPGASRPSVIRLLTARLGKDRWMADDSVDLRFLGRQVQTLQGDVRDLRSDHLRLVSDVAGLRADIARLQSESEMTGERVGRLDSRVAQLESEVRAGFKAVDARFDQVSQTMATNLQVILTAIGK
jgi:hypothetical protein